MENISIFDASVLSSQNYLKKGLITETYVFNDGGFESQQTDVVGVYFTAQDNTSIPPKIEKDSVKRFKNDILKLCLY